METRGYVIEVLEATSGVSEKTGKEWRNQSFVIETGGEYPKAQCFSVFGTERTIPNVGDEVKVQFNFVSRKYKDNWYSEGRCYKLDILTMAESWNEIQHEEKLPTEVALPAAEEDDLPF